MLPLYRDPHFTFRFADDRIIPRFHLEAADAGRRGRGSSSYPNQLANNERPGWQRMP
jgi:hypothetical protein